MVLYARSSGSLARFRIQDKGRCVKHFKLSVPTTESIKARSWLARECRLRLGCIKGEGGPRGRHDQAPSDQTLSLVKRTTVPKTGTGETPRSAVAERWE